MIELTLDIFSGRRNPMWVVPLSAVRRLLGSIASEVNFRHSPATIPSRLGYRGVHIRMLSGAALGRGDLPPWLYLVPDPSNIVRHMQQVAELISIVERVGKTVYGLQQSGVLRLIERVFADLALVIGGVSRTIAPPAQLRPTGPCAFEMLGYDPNFWNDPAHIRLNNCYAYASNQRTDTFPQPGRGSGHEISGLNCADAIAASKSDGMHDVTDCFPDTEAPRDLVALVIWPGNDYHWYRKHADFWGHKPGQTNARNVDSSNTIITNPETCDRGPYTDFCGYFLLPKSQKVQ